jgi:hypothetical protein
MFTPDHNHDTSTNHNHNTSTNHLHHICPHNYIACPHNYHLPCYNNFAVYNQYNPSSNHFRQLGSKNPVYNW